MRTLHLTQPETQYLIDQTFAPSLMLEPVAILPEQYFTALIPSLVQEMTLPHSLPPLYLHLFQVCFKVKLSFLK